MKNKIYYKSILQNSTIVIKISGKVINDKKNIINIVEDIKEIISNIKQIKIVVIFGLGYQLDNYILSNFNKKSIKHNGRRVTNNNEINAIKRISGEILLEDIFNTTVNDKIKLEYGEGNIIMDATSASIEASSETGGVLTFRENEGSFLTFETETLDTTKVALESFNIFPAEGQIPKANFRLSYRNDTAYKSKYGYTPVVVPAEVTVRDTGDIALEDATDDTHGFLVLDTAAHAGDNIDLEGATGITF